MKMMEGSMARKNRIFGFVAALVAVVAVVDQLGRKPENRDWNGSVLGVPYDYRLPTVDRLVARVWNPDDERIVVPIVIGVGWTINLYQVKRKIQLLIA